MSTDISKRPQKDRTYRLLGGATLWATIPSRNLPKHPLFYFDEVKNINRPLRYAINQRSPFEDEQDGGAIMEPIVFEDGMLSVPKTNPVLQWFLELHPMNGRTFAEVDTERDAEKELAAFDTAVDALIECKNLSIEQCEMITRIMMGKDPSLITTKEMRRDLMVFAKNDPSGFLTCLHDPDIKMQSTVRILFDQGLIAARNNDKDVWFNTPTNKKKMMSVPFDTTPVDAVCAYLKTDEGIEVMKMLETFVS
jgi:hypothetical protein